MEIDKKKQLAVSLVIAGVGVISAIIGILAYKENVKHQRVQQDLVAIDKEIKLLQLATAKEKAKADKLI